MSYTMSDFPASDLNQYFGGTWIKHRTKKGNLRSGIIMEFVGDRAIVENERGSKSCVALSSIEWSGLLGPRCITWEGYLVFIAPSGARVHKKPPNERNTVALLYRNGPIPVLLGRGTSHGSMRSSMLRAYLEDEDYPDDYTSARSLIRSGSSALPLSPTEGVFQERDSGAWRGVRDGIIATDPECLTGILTFIQEVYKHERS